jgi:hypothetical protein
MLTRSDDGKGSHEPEAHAGYEAHAGLRPASAPPARSPRAETCAAVREIAQPNRRSDVYALPAVLPKLNLQFWPEVSFRQNRSLDMVVGVRGRWYDKHIGLFWCFGRRMQVGLFWCFRRRMQVEALQGLAGRDAHRTAGFQAPVP